MSRVGVVSEARRGAGVGVGVGAGREESGGVVGEGGGAGVRCGDEAPARVGFFQEASLAHETACALRDIGQPHDAEIHFKRSVATRRRQQFARTHSVTLGYLGAIQVQRGNLDEACATWNEALDAMTGVQSGRTRDVIVRIQSDLSPVRQRGGRHVTALDRRARGMLRAIG
ncbi:hypothetical protein STPH2_1949 [Streptomyces sp. KO7888]|nr:hypothetical protein [Streptomyces sp. KO7888]